MRTRTRRRSASGSMCTSDAPSRIACARTKLTICASASLAVRIAVTVAGPRVAGASWRGDAAGVAGGSGLGAEGVSSTARGPARGNGTSSPGA